MKNETKIAIGMLSYLAIGLIMGKISERDTAFYFLVAFFPALVIIISLFIWVVYLDGVSKDKKRGIRNGRGLK